MKLYDKYLKVVRKVENYKTNRDNHLIIEHVRK